MDSRVCGVPRYRMRPLRSATMEVNSFESVMSFARSVAVRPFLVVSMSSGINRSPRYPCSEEVMPRQFTDADLSTPLRDQCTSNSSTEVRSPAYLSGARYCSTGQL
ncbi:hypothetical protein D9M71_762960 [compost metagenome]